LFFFNPIVLEKNERKGKNVYLSQCELGHWNSIMQLKKVGSNAFIYDLNKDFIVLCFQKLISFKGYCHILD
jgi:hypothetical protein